MIRPQLLSVAGSRFRRHTAAKCSQVQIDLDPQALQARGFRAGCRDRAGAAEPDHPAGTQKIGGFEYNIRLNDSPLTIDQLNALPIRSVNGAVIFMRDVARARRLSAAGQHRVRVDGRRAVLMSVLKSGSASTLDIISGQGASCRIEATLPPSLRLVVMGDQSVFVKGAVSGVAREGLIAAALTSAMILLFLGSWRSTLIIAASIPLAVLAAIAALAAAGERST